MKRMLFFLLLSCATSVMAQTDLYNRYSRRTDVRVASVTNFTLDTGITADVTLLEVIDDQSWQWLCSTFGLATPTKEQEQQIADGWDVTMFTQRSRQDPTKPAPVVDEHIDQGNSCYLGVSYLSRTIYIFCCSTEKQSDVVIAYLLRKMTSLSSQ